MLTPADPPPAGPDTPTGPDTPADPGTPADPAAPAGPGAPPASNTSASAPRVRHGLPALLPTLREAKSGLLVLALSVGCGAGLGAIAFRWLIKTFTRALSGHADYSAAGHAANPHVPWLGRWFVLLAPVAGRAASTGRWCSASPGRRAGTACPR